MTFPEKLKSWIRKYLYFNEAYGELALDEAGDDIGKLQDILRDCMSYAIYDAILPGWAAVHYDYDKVEVRDWVEDATEKWVNHVCKKSAGYPLYVEEEKQSTDSDKA